MDYLLAGLVLYLMTRRGDRKKTAEEGSAAQLTSTAEQILRRANQPKAKEWIPVLERAGAPADLAAMVSRWIGIESGGRPRTFSHIGERGLTQVHPKEKDDGAVTEDQWHAMSVAKTTPDEHAAIALRHVTWEWGRAKRHVSDWPESTENQVWAAKLYHGRPVSFRDAKPRGGARAAARDLSKRWAKRPNDLKRLMVANIVTWGHPAAPE